MEVISQPNPINEKRLVSFFKSFVDSVMLPLLRTNDHIVSEWNRFTNMLSQDRVDYTNLEIYIDVLLKSKKSESATPTLNFSSNETGRRGSRSRHFNQQIGTSSHPLFTENGFHLNKTLGVMEKREVDALLSNKPSTPSARQFKLVPRLSMNLPIQIVPDNRGECPSPVKLIVSGMEAVHKSLNDNQKRMQQQTWHPNGGEQIFKFRSQSRNN